MQSHAHKLNRLWNLFPKSHMKMKDFYIQLNPAAARRSSSFCLFFSVHFAHGNKRIDIIVNTTEKTNSIFLYNITVIYHTYARGMSGERMIPSISDRERFTFAKMIYFHIQSLQ